MDGLLTYIELHVTGIFTIAVLVFLLLFFIQWFSWIFSLGRFKKIPGTEGFSPADKPQTLRYLVADGLVKIINDFRHLLALIIILIFGMALAYTLIRSGGNVNDVKDVLQAVSATLGSLVATIIGYYFGESSAKRAALSTPSPSTSQGPQDVSTPVQGAANNDATIREPKKPGSD